MSANFFVFVPSQKLEHRIKALEKTTWGDQTKNEVRQVLTAEYTSSDESNYEDDSDCDGVQLTSYKVKHLPWERTKLANAKKILDEIYVKSLSARVRRSRVPRIEHPLASERDIPQNLVGWAVRRPAPSASDSSSFSGGPLSSSTPRVTRHRPAV